MIIIFKIMKGEINKYILEMKNYYPDYIGNIFLTMLFFLIFFSKIDIIENKEEGITLIVGFTFWFFSSNSISQMSMSISEEKQVGTFEQLLLKPISIEKILVIRTFCWNLVSLIIVTIIYILIFLIFNIKININFNIFLLIYIYIITIISFIGIGYFLASCTLIYTKTASFSSIIEYILLFISGAIIPLEELPLGLLFISKLIPISHTIKIITSIILNRDISFKYIVVFTFLCVLYYIIGLAIFKNSLKRASIKGINSKF